MSGYFECIVVLTRFKVPKSEVLWEGEARRGTPYALSAEIWKPTFRGLLQAEGMRDSWYGRVVGNPERGILATSKAS